MALKGTATIELTDVHTGRKEIVKHDNLVTNAVADALLGNGFGWMLDRSAMSIYPETEMLPLAGNLFGGILLFEQALEENVAKYYAPSSNPVVGYSSNVVNSGGDVKRGSLNIAESGPLEDGRGHRFVFDFSTYQGNGTIASLGLTSKWGGVGAYGSETNSSSRAIKLTNRSITCNDVTAYPEREFKNYCEACAFNDSKGVLITFLITATNEISIYEIPRLISRVSLHGPVNLKFDSAAVPAKTIKTSVFGTHAVNAAFVQSGDFVYGFETSATASGAMRWIKVKLSDYSFSEGTWTLNASPCSPGYRYDNANNFTVIKYCIVHNGYLYIVSYNRNGIYRINLDNPADIKLLTFADGRAVDVYYDSTTSSYNKCVSMLNVVGDVVVFRNGYIQGDELIPCVYTEKSTSLALSNNCASPALVCGPFLLTIGCNYRSTSNKVFYESIYLMTPYLATINNLDTPVTKTADKTMKITYILREE